MRDNFAHAGTPFLDIQHSVQRSKRITQIKIVQRIERRGDDHIIGILVREINRSEIIDASVDQ